MTHQVDDGDGQRCVPKQVQAGLASHSGLIRSLNEDRLLMLELLLGQGVTDTPFCLYAVADGMGGCTAGGIASYLALALMTRSVLSSILSPGLRGEPSTLDREFISQALVEAFRAANREVYTRGQALGRDMGTTLAAAIVIGNAAYIANVGDSRVYLLQGENIRQITSDHSLVASMVATGEITPEEVYTHSQRNIVTRCLGIEEQIQVDTFTEELGAGSHLVLCSDGLWEMVRDDEIKRIVLEASVPQTASEQLVELANKNGGEDNVSIIIVGVSS